MAIDEAKIRTYISDHRLQKYLDICGGDMRKALKLYQTNLQVSRAFYPLLALVEVVLRNAIDEEMKLAFRDPDWLRTQQTVFMSHPSLTYRDSSGRLHVNNFLKNCVSQSIRELGVAAPHCKILANLKFGFWTSFFSKPHYKVLMGKPIQIFPNLPPGMNRNTVYDRLISIKDFRNRIYHYEPIIFENIGGDFVFSTRIALERHDQIRELFEWFGLDFDAWTKKVNNVLFELQRAKCVIKSYPKFQYYYHRIIIGLIHYKNKYLR